MVARKRVRVQEPSKKDVRVMMDYWDLTDIVPYEKNPRYNEEAVEYVAKSIEKYGFNVPMVITSDGVIVAGHTRYEAAKSLGMTDVPVIINDSLTEEELDAFRLVDNKVAEKAEWNHDLLAEEINRLSDLGLDFTGLGWSAEEIDCMRDMIADDCLSVGAAASMDQDHDSTAQGSEPRAPSRTRLVVGEFVVFIPTSVYKKWAAQIRVENDYDQDAIEDDLLERLGVTPYME